MFTAIAVCSIALILIPLSRYKESLMSSKFEKLSQALMDQSEIEEDCCGNCVWFQGKDETCHRMPPQILIQDDLSKFGVMQVRAVWPSVRKDEWCGEFDGGE